MHFLHNVNDLMLDQILPTIFAFSVHDDQSKIKNNQRTTTRQDENKPILMTEHNSLVYTFIPCKSMLPPSDARPPGNIIFSCASRHYK